MLLENLFIVCSIFISYAASYNSASLLNAEVEDALSRARLALLIPRASKVSARDIALLKRRLLTQQLEQLRANSKDLPEVTEVADAQKPNNDQEPKKLTFGLLNKFIKHKICHNNNCKKYPPKCVYPNDCPPYYPPHHYPGPSHHYPPSGPPANHYPPSGPPVNHYPPVPPVNNYPPGPPANNYPQSGPPANHYPPSGPPANHYPPGSPSNNPPPAPPNYPGPPTNLPQCAYPNNCPPKGQLQTQTQTQTQWQGRSSKSGLTKKAVNVVDVVTDLMN